jgi:UDP-glucose 4-epimerase
MLTGNVIEGKIVRALVTGGAGLVGSEIVDQLLAAGHTVMTLDNYVSGKSSNLDFAKGFRQFTEIEGSINDEKLVDEILSSGIDWVFHQACSKNTVCLLDPQKDLYVNGSGTLGMLIAARKYGVKRFVHASTGSVYGRPEVFPTLENSRKDPVSFYGVSKLAAETYVDLFHNFYGLPTVILRYFHVFGSRQDSSDTGGVVSIFINKALSNQDIRITGDGSQIRAFTHVKHVAKMNLLAAQEKKAIGKVYNCASDARVTIKQLADKVLSLSTNTESRIRFTEERIGDIYKFDVDNKSLKSDLKFDFSSSFEEDLIMTFNEIYDSRT